MPYAKSSYITNTALESVCFDFMSEAKDFVADSVFTVKPVKKTDMKVYQADTSKLRRYNTKSQTDSLAGMIDEQFFTRNLTLAEYKLGKEINPRIVRDADIGALFSEARAAKIVTNALMIDREVLAATLATTAANYASTLSSTLSGASRWDDAGNPEAAKQTADTAVQALSGIKRLNAMVCDVQVIRALKSNAAFVDRTKYTKGSPVDLEAMKLFFDVDYIFIAGSTYDSANEGGTRTLASPWGKDVIFFYHNPSADLEDVSFGHMYLVEQPFWTKIYEDPKRNGPAGSMKILEVGTEYMLDKGYVESSSSDKFAAGYLYKSVIA